MSFIIQAFDLSSFAGAPKAGSFADVSFNEWNRISHDGDGKLVISLSGAEPRKVRSQQVVLAGFEGESFQQTRRSFYMTQWKPGQETTAPDCQSADGVAPDASAPNPQSNSCKTCPHSSKDAASKCSYRKDFLLYMVNPTFDGGAAIDTGTAFTWTASSLSLFPKFDDETKSAGAFEMVKLLAKAGATIEAVVLELGFHSSSKAPTLKAVGLLPEVQMTEVITAAKQPEVRALLTSNADRAAKAPALVAPARRPAPPVDTPRAEAKAAITRAARPAPAEVAIPEEELYQAPAPVAPPVAVSAPVLAPAPVAPAETDDEREEREMEEALARKKAARLAAANQPATARVIESTATVRTMPAPIAPPAAAVAAPAPVAAAAPSASRSAAFNAFNAARKG